MAWDAETIRQAAETLALGGAPVEGISAVCGIAARLERDAHTHDIIVIMPDGFDERVTLADGPLLVKQAEIIVSQATRFDGGSSVDLDSLSYAFEAWAILEPLMRRHRANMARIDAAAKRAAQDLPDPGWVMSVQNGVFMASPAEVTPPADTTSDPADSAEQ